MKNERLFSVARRGHQPNRKALNQISERPRANGQGMQTFPMCETYRHNVTEEVSRKDRQPESCLDEFQAVQFRSVENIWESKIIQREKTFLMVQNSNKIEKET